MASDRPGCKWIEVLRDLPGVVEVEVKGDYLVAVVSTREHGKQVRSAVGRLGMPREALRIRVMRYWLYPYPDPEKSQRVLERRMSRWEREDEDL